MALRSPGYSNWKYLGLSEEEKKHQELAQSLIRGFVADLYSEEVSNKISVEFGKAVLTIDAAEGTSGAFHNLADGMPFYRVEVTTEKSFESMDPSVMVVLGLVNSQGPSSMSMHPVTWSQDFRDATIMQKAWELGYLIQAIAEYEAKQKAAPNRPKPPGLN